MIKSALQKSYVVLRFQVTLCLMFCSRDDQPMTALERDQSPPKLLKKNILSIYLIMCMYLDIKKYNIKTQI